MELFAGSFPGYSNGSHYNNDASILQLEFVQADLVEEQIHWKIEIDSSMFQSAVAVGLTDCWLIFIHWSNN